MIYKSEIIMQKTEGFLQPAPFIVGDCNGWKYFGCGGVRFLE